MPADDLNRTGETCLAALDGVIARGAEAPHQDVAEAVRCVITLRNQLLRLYRDGSVSRARLDEVNALVSLAHGAEHPLIGFHLHRLEQARDCAKALLSKV